jgi:hypothetical protein
VKFDGVDKMINPILKMEVDDFVADYANAEKYPNLFIFLENMKEKMEIGIKSGL